MAQALRFPRHRRSWGGSGGSSLPPNQTGNRAEITHADIGRYLPEMDWENLLALCCSILLAGYLVYALVNPERF
jgi:K+-transporting ATPase KdpF subunit